MANTYYYGVKLLCEDSGSICARNRVFYPMGEWVQVGGNGAYIAIGPENICSGGIGHIVSVFMFDTVNLDAQKLGSIPKDVITSNDVKRVDDLKNVDFELHKQTYNAYLKALDGNTRYRYIYYHNTVKLSQNIWHEFTQWLERETRKPYPAKCCANCLYSQYGPKNQMIQKGYESYQLICTRHAPDFSYDQNNFPIAVWPWVKESHWCGDFVNPKASIEKK